MDFKTRSAELNSAYRLTLNPTRVVVQPNKMITSIAPTWHGKFLPSEPVFHYALQDETTQLVPGKQDALPPQVPKNIPIACPSNENIFITHYSGEKAFSGPIDKLTVILIGNEEIPDVRMYASSVTTVEFTGHLSYTGPVFNLLRQLPLVTSVKFFIGQSQLPIFREIVDVEFNIAYSATPVCPGVESLEIIMDLQCYYQPPSTCSNACSNHCWDMIKTTFDTLVESLFNRCKQSFPNLKNFKTHLPDSDIFQTLRNAEINLLGRSSISDNLGGDRNGLAAAESEVCGNRHSDNNLSDGYPSTLSNSLSPQEDDASSVSTACSSLSE